MFKDLSKIVEVLLKDRTITIGKAMERFALTMPIISSFCSKHSEKYPFIFYQNNVMKRRKIDFHDAFKMAMERKGGLQTVVKLNARSKAISDKAAKKLFDSADQLQLVSKQQCKTMSRRVKDSLAALKEDGDAERFRFNLHTLKSLADFLLRTKSIVNWLRYVLDHPELNKDKKIIKEAYKSVGIAMRKAVVRFNSSHHLGKYERIML